MELILNLVINTLSVVSAKFNVSTLLGSKEANCRSRISFRELLGKISTAPFCYPSPQKLALGLIRIIQTQIVL